MNKISLLITTINVPYFLDDISKLSKKNNIFFDAIIIGDKKTNPKIYRYLSNVKKKYPKNNFEYYDVKSQIKFFKNLNKFYKVMPYNSGSRKMLANLIATTRNYECSIMIDDDNFINDDFFKFHNFVGKQKKIKVISTKQKYFNIYESLQEKTNLKFYPRGFPWSERFKKNKYSITEKKVNIDMINGLVLQDPDIDAISRLFWPINVEGVKNKFLPLFALQSHSWTSFNNQNTSTSKRFTDIYFTPPSTGRNSDIWTSYVMYKIINALNSYICFGRPIVRQIRNPHNLWIDLKDELQNNINTDNFVDLLRNVKLTNSNNPIELMYDLIAKSMRMIKSKKILDLDFMITNFFKEYKIWLDTVIYLRKRKIKL